jgi:hypothetical protein
MPATTPNKFAFTENAKRIREIHARINAGHAIRVEDGGVAWKAALKEFAEKVDALSFPGGMGGVLDRIVNGDAVTIEHALEFVEAHPYFFRSQYIRAKLVRRLKHAPLSERQSARLQRALDLERSRKLAKRASNA